MKAKEEPKRIKITALRSKIIQQKLENCEEKRLVSEAKCENRWKCENLSRLKGSSLFCLFCRGEKWNCSSEGLILLLFIRGWRRSRRSNERTQPHVMLLGGEYYYFYIATGLFLPATSRRQKRWKKFSPGQLNVIDCGVDASTNYALQRRREKGNNKSGHLMKKFWVEDGEERGMKHLNPQTHQQLWAEWHTVESVVSQQNENIWSTRWLGKNSSSSSFHPRITFPSSNLILYVEF